MIARGRKRVLAWPVRAGRRDWQRHRDAGRMQAHRPDVLEVLEPLRRSLGDVRVSTPQFDQAQVLLGAIDRFVRRMTAGQDGSGGRLDDTFSGTNSGTRHGETLS